MKRTTKIAGIILSLVLVMSSMPLTALADTTTINVATGASLLEACTFINASDGGDYIISLEDDITVEGFSLSKSGTVTTIIGNGHTISLSATTSGAVGVDNGVTLNLGDSTDASNTLVLQGDRNSGDGAKGIELNNGATCNMYAGTTVTDFVGNNTFGGGVSVYYGSTFHMYGGTIDDCGISGGSVCYGGGVAVSVGSTFIMDGGTISSCFADTDCPAGTCPSGDTRTLPALGGGVFVSKGSVFTMNSGTITGCYVLNNEAMTGGGGIALVKTATSYPSGYLDSSVTINGGTISNNDADLGGGILVSGQYYAFASAIAYTTPPYNPVSSAGLFLNGGTVSGNGSYYGAGILAMSCRNSLMFKDATISGNDAAGNGGGICVMGFWCNATVDGCTITGNTSEDKGAGVYYDNNSTLNIKGANTIQSNTWNGVTNNLNIYSTSKLVNVTGSLEGSSIGLTDPLLRDDGISDSAAEDDASATKLTSGYTTYNSANPNTLFTSDHDTWYADLSEDETEARLVRIMREPNNLVSLTTKDSVDINFDLDVDYYLPNASDKENAYVMLNYNHNPITYSTQFADERRNIKDITPNEDGTYRFTIESAPAQLTENIKITLYNGAGTKLYDANYSMWQYCDDIIGQAITMHEMTADPEVVAKWDKAAEVCKALTDYATAAQKYFNYNTSDMADKSVVERVGGGKYYFDEFDSNLRYFHDVRNVAINTGAKTISGTVNESTVTARPVANVEGTLPFEITETSLMSLSNTEVRFYFDEKAVDPENYTVSVSVDTEGEDAWFGSSRPTAGFNTANSGSFIEVKGIESANLDNAFHLTITDKSTNQSATINYSAIAYCYTVLRDTTSADDFDEPEKVNQLRSLVKSIYMYNQYANDYFTTA
ncbi:MAG: hypothetical protein IJI47_05740 [Eubacterium sp.]|nr:hypothetical protein [Eubacterium sp.]MBR0413048.1 hypothetical protein [Eubacterium sp.]